MDDLECFKPEPPGKITIFIRQSTICMAIFQSAVRKLFVYHRVVHVLCDLSGFAEGKTSMAGAGVGSCRSKLETLMT